MRILLVDDDRAILDSLQETLNWEKIGIDEVETASSVDQAEKLLLKREADIVVSDIELPGKSGLDFLEWFREKQMTGKFLLLTGFESFEYAKQAVRLHAEEYLIKPFSASMMEILLQKMVLSRREDLEKEESQKLGEWAKDNGREIVRHFWEDIFSGRIHGGQESILKKVRERGMTLPSEASFRLIAIKVTETEEDERQLGSGLFEFSLQNIVSEIFFGSPENEAVICRSEGGSRILLCASVFSSADEAVRKCRELKERCDALLASTITCCVSEETGLCDLKETADRCTALLGSSVMYYGEIFLERDASGTKEGYEPVLKLETMQALLDARDNRGFLDYLKKEIDARTRVHLLDRSVLSLIHREIQQAVYAYLAREGIQVTLLLSDPTGMDMAEKADRSVIDMMRWTNYFLRKVFEYEDSLREADDIISRIDGYIREHYQEDIGRTEIGEAFFLVPEYLSRMYKKKTGQNLKDAINECRLSHARTLLSGSDHLVSEIALEVGFDSFSYFSTVFKKSVGMTPNEYRKRHSS